MDAAYYNPAMSLCRRFRVQGRVQGVFFRASTRAQAQRLGVTGWVANRADGGVEGLACGGPQALEDFCAWLWQGPEQAAVCQVELVPEEHPRPRDFTIR